MKKSAKVIRKSTLILTILAIVVMFILLVVIMSSINGLNNAVTTRTNNYVRDVSEQSAQVIEERFKGFLSTLRILGDSMVGKTTEERAEILQRRVGMSLFQQIAYVDKSGSIIHVNDDGKITIYEETPEAYWDETAYNKVFNGETFVEVYPYLNAFMEPVYDGDKIIGLIMGIRFKESLENLLVNDSFDSQGYTFIVDDKGKILVTPPSLDVVEEDISEIIKEMTGEAGDGSALTKTLERENDKNLILDLQPLNVFNWSVVTMVSEDFLVSEVNSFVIRMIILTFILVAIFMALFIFMIAMQSRYSNHLEEMAFIDPVTGGKSFIRFRMFAEQIIPNAQDEEYAFVSLNVKRFKMINRMGGSIEGDEILRKIYYIIEEELKYPDELVAHGSADNYSLLLRYEGDDELKGRLANIAKKLEDIKTVLPLHVSMGVYVVTDPELDVILFLDRANLARLSGAERYNTTCIFYDDNFVKQQEERVYMTGMIEEGLERDEFKVFLQPKVSPQLNEVEGAEALVRWMRPDKGMIAPDVFIPLCEQNGLICAIDLYVFEKVCSQIKLWMEKGYKVPIISVNVSGQHLKDIEFLAKYRTISDKYGIDPGKIELEFTESIMFSDSGISKAHLIIDEIHKYGYRCSMDDFGSGYSALGLLQELPIDCIKLDRSFFIHSIDNSRAQIVINAIIKMAQQLEIITVAEGVEKEVQVEMLKDMGCDLIQGYYYSPPLPISDFDEMVFIKHTPYSQRGTSGKI